MHPADRLTTVYREVTVYRLGIPTAVLPGGDLLIEPLEGARIVITNHAPADPEFLHLHACMRAPGLSAALINLVNARIKGAKLALRGDDLVISVEMIVAAASCVPSHDTLAVVLPRAINMLINGVNDVLEQTSQHRAS